MVADSMARAKDERARSKSNWLARMAWAYCFAMILVAFILHRFGDVYWWGTVLLFGPRWPWLWPMALVLVVAYRAKQLSLWIASSVSTLIVIFGIVGFVWPIQRPLVNENDLRIRVFTCNLGADLVDPKKLCELLDSWSPDLVALQETPKNIERVLPPGRWHWVRRGELLVGSRFACNALSNQQLSSVWRLHGAPICNLVEIELPEAPPCRFAAVHFSTPRQGLTTLLDRRFGINPARQALLNWQTQWRHLEQQHTSQWLTEETGPLIIAGDFNTPVESAVFGDAWGDFNNAFSQSGFGMGATIFARHGPIGFWSRIDHVLFGDQWYCEQAIVLPSVGSDHLPLLADLRLRRQISAN